MQFSQLVSQLGQVESSSLTAHPDRDPEIAGVAAIDVAGPHQVSYIEGEKFVKYLDSTTASALILPNRLELQAQADQRGIAWVSSRDPRRGFALAIAAFYTPFHPAPGIHPTAVVDPSAKLGKDITLSAHVVIQAGVTVEDGVCIHPNVVVYPQAHIGAGTILHANCTIHERVQIGRDCVIHSGAVIGAEGFGFVPTRDGWEKMQQSGQVVLEDRVEIGCNAAVDRPAVGETRIGHDTKLDNMVHIGHGCQIGWGVAIAGQTGLAGGVTIGNRAILAGQVGVANQAHIGDGATLTAQAGVLHNVAPGEVVSGSPAVPYKIYLKVSAIYSRLPEMYDIIRRLKRSA
jgi:UDP-3-O-[3-hydroxymyristoyl] glucosamine N-acyltransferase